MPPTKKAPKIKVQGITPFLWYQKDAEKAARYYVSLFQNSRVTSADPMSVRFTLAGQDFFALNGGDSYELTPAYSMFVSVRTQKEVDQLWSALTKNGGEESMCGWLVDKFGLSWQIIPERLMELLSHKDAGVRERATKAMFTMRKIDIATLEKAARGK